MAKRKRLMPANPDYLAGPQADGAGALAGPLPRSSAPIADVAQDSAAVAALAELSQKWQDARETGRIVLDLPHDAIRLDHLERDRGAVSAEETEALMASLRANGQQTPIEVVALPSGSEYGLLSGWRRCHAVRALFEETGEARFSTVQALIRKPEDAPAAYRTMIEENEIRANLSHYERARIVVRSVAAGVFADDQQALSSLFRSVPRARRSKIKSFLALVHGFDDLLRFPEAITERLGLEVAQRLRSDPAFADRLAAALRKADSVNAAMEQAVISTALRGEEDMPPAPSASSPETHSEADNLLRASGVTLRRDRKGALVLSGPAVDGDLEAALISWLEAYLAR